MHSLVSSLFCFAVTAFHVISVGQPHLSSYQNLLKSVCFCKAVAFTPEVASLQRMMTSSVLFHFVIVKYFGRIGDERETYLPTFR